MRTTLELPKPLARARVRLATMVEDYAPALRRFIWESDWVQFVACSVLILTLHALTRPLFAAPTPAASHRAAVVFADLALREIELLRQAMKAQRPAVPAFLFPLLPTALLLLAKTRIRWETWEAGQALRVLVMTIVMTLAWAGATFEYNMYLDRGHALDRLLLVALAIASWKRPLAVPFFTVLAVVMLREANSPLGHDDFDWRPMTEILMLFSCFAWLSFLRSIETKHFLLLALCLYGAYYYQAGVSKLFYGETGSWLTQNRLSNLFVSSYAHGWLGFLPASSFVALAKLSRHLDFVNALFALAVAELGSIVFLNLQPRLARAWLLCAALLHTGIFAFSGIFFWKWIVVDLALWHFVRRGGATVHAQIFASKLVPMFGAALIFFSTGKTYFNPQIGVAWWDTKLSESYHLYAVGKSGRSWPVSPASFAPYEARMMQEDWCFVTRERRLTAIYGTTGSFAVFQELEAARTAEDVARIVSRHGWSCHDVARAKSFDGFVAEFFENTNRAGGRKHRWLSLIGRPAHIWAQRQSDDFAFQEPVVCVEIWRERRLWNGDAIVPVGSEKIHVIQVP
jgi:hypothetical protein